MNMGNLSSDPFALVTVIDHAVTAVWHLYRQAGAFGGPLTTTSRTPGGDDQTVQRVLAEMLAHGIPAERIELRNDRQQGERTIRLTLSARFPYVYGQCCVTASEAIEVARQGGLNVVPVDPYHLPLRTPDGRKVPWWPVGRGDYREEDRTVKVTVTFLIEG
jgi:hypothetical protein